MTNSPSLLDLLQGPEIVLVPGIYDAFGALMVERAGFSAAYLSGASIAYTRFGRPDLGLVGMDEVAAVISAIGERVQVPLIVDADTGYGNALNVIRTVKLFERNGATSFSWRIRAYRNAAVIWPERPWCRQAKWSARSRPPWMPGIAPIR
jgi:2-methylisocitrate lyase-like PEP mutase family enzyme